MVTVLEDAQVSAHLHSARAWGCLKGSNPSSATHWLCDHRLMSYCSEPQFPHL